MNRFIRALVFASIFAAPAAALAQVGTSTITKFEAAKPVPPGFEKVAGAPDAQKIDASRLVVIAYIAIFSGVFGYVIFVSRRQAELAKEMAELAARIDKVKK